MHATANHDEVTDAFSTASNLSADAGGGFFKKTSGEQFSLESWDFVRLSTMIENELHNLHLSRILSFRGAWLEQPSSP